LETNFVGGKFLPPCLGTFPFSVVQPNFCIGWQTLVVLPLLYQPPNLLVEEFHQLWNFACGGNSLHHLETYSISGPQSFINHHVQA
jgi:hypothetical protein